METLPKYRDLPLDPSKPAGSTWGLFGPTDEVGTLNLLTGDKVVAASRLVQKGAVFTLSLDLETPDPPLLGREALRHAVIDQASGTDDRYDNFHTQASSQWDALAHIGHPDFGYYNGWQRNDITGRQGGHLGIDHWARRGIVGRFVLVDFDRVRKAQGQPISPAERSDFTAQDLDQALEIEKVVVGEGDILLLRFGWVAWYREADKETRRRLAAAPTPLDASDDEGAFFPTPGLSPHESTAEWLWDHRIAAVAGDVPSLEAMPFNRSAPDTFLHYRIIALLGMAVGEMFDLDSLAADCANDHVYEGLFTAAPLNKIGGSGSTANALAIK